MSLFKQLWVAILLLIVLAIGGSVIVSALTAKNYLNDQLYQKNIDSANALALIVGGANYEPVTAELQIASQFDSGFYQSIRLRDLDKNIIVERSETVNTPGVPSWFVNLIPIDPEPGNARVTKGWQQIGDIEVMSHTKFAYSALWRNGIQLASYFVIAGLLCGFIGTVLIQKLIQPLNNVVEQAQAIGDRRFITIAEPKTLEFKFLVQSMNKLSLRIKQLLESETSKLASVKSESSTDSVTQLLSADYFHNSVNATLNRDDASASGILIIFRILDLNILNDQYGRENTDNLLLSVAKKIHQFQSEFDDSISGKLNGSDFGLLLPDKYDLDEIASLLHIRLVNAARALEEFESIIIHGSASKYFPGEKAKTVIARVDLSLSSIQQRSSSILETISADQDKSLPNDRDSWLSLFDEAIDSESFELASFPVNNRQGNTIHNEAPLRLKTKEGKLLAAGQFMNWATRLHKITQIDTIAIRRALVLLSNSKQNIGINISSQLLTSEKAMDSVIALITNHSSPLDRLWLEVPERGVYSNLAAFRKLCSALKIKGCKLGIEHAGHKIEKLGELHDLGLDYLKIDSAFVSNIDSNTGNQIFLRGLCSISNTMGVKVIAEGVRTKAENDCLFELGFEGVTGPGVK